MRLARTGAAVVCGLVLAWTHARGELLVYEGFDYPVGSLSGQGGGIGFASGSTWTGGEVVAGSLNYTDAGSNDLPTSGNHALLNAQNGSLSLYRALSRAYGSGTEYGPGTYWVSFLGQRLTPHPTLDENSIRSHALQLHDGTGDERIAAGKPTTVSPVSTSVTIFSDGSGSLADASTAPIHDLNFILMQINIVDSIDGNNSDEAAMWINPSLDGPLGTPDAELTQAAGNNFDYLFDTVRLWSAGGNTDGPYASWIIDEIRIGTQLEDAFGVVPLPGDTDGNGVVDLQDLVPIRTNYRTMQTERIAGDLNGDFFVDFADFRQWKTGLLDNGGSLAGVDLAFLAVPEPSTIAMLLVFGCVGAWRVRPAMLPVWQSRVRTQ